MPKKLPDPIQDWVSTILKSLAICLVSLGVFVFNNLNHNVETSFSALNENLKGLTLQLKAMENHQIESDKRIAAIEVSREINMTGYQKLLSDVSEIKQSQAQQTMRIQTIADFMANSFSKKK